MPFSQQYKILTESEDPIAKSRVLPRNIYKITSYKYTDGTQKTLSGVDTSLVFVLGIYDKKLSCIKISEMKPEKFLNWMSGLFKTGLIKENINSTQPLEDLLILADKQGKKLVSMVQQSSAIYNHNPNPYRTYNLTGIKQIYEVKLKADVLKKYYK
jgi:hypothetical protein